MKYTCDNCKCIECAENFLNRAGVTCMQCIDCEECNQHIEECSTFYDINYIIDDTQ